MKAQREAVAEVASLDRRIVELQRELKAQECSAVEAEPNPLKEAERLLEFAEEILKRHWVEEYTVLAWRADYRDYRFRKTRRGTQTDF